MKKQRAKPRHLESKIQIECVRWFRYQHPKVVVFAIPNGGARNPREGGILKAEGVLAGVPDLFIARPVSMLLEGVVSNHHGLFIEMKTDKGALKANQKELHSRLHDAGYAVALCRSFDEFRSTVNWYIGTK